MTLQHVHVVKYCDNLEQQVLVYELSPEILLLLLLMNTPVQVQRRHTHSNIDYLVEIT